MTTQPDTDAPPTGATAEIRRDLTDYYLGHGRTPPMQSFANAAKRAQQTLQAAIEESATSSDDAPREGRPTTEAVRGPKAQRLHAMVTAYSHGHDADCRCRWGRAIDAALHEAAAGALPSVEALRKIVERTSRMGLCSQTHHEHLMRAAHDCLASSKEDRP